MEHTLCGVTIDCARSGIVAPADAGIVNAVNAELRIGDELIEIHDGTLNQIGGYAVD